MTEQTLKRTPLYETHKRLKSRMVPFAGWEMPVQYSGILEESRAVRNAVGLFDISHMGRIHIYGKGALALLQSVTSNNVDALGPGQAQYSLLTNPSGGIIDDIIVYRKDQEDFLVVINASNTDKDLRWIREHAPDTVTMEDHTEQTAMIAVQGPAAPQIVSQMAGEDLLSVPRFGFREASLFGQPATLCRTGYTGEDGFEIIVPAAASEAVWNRLMESGGVPCGLGARDALRIEAGYPLYGHEIDDSTSPVEAGLMWVVKPEKGDFIGKEAILALQERGASRRLMGLVLQERIAPRQGYTLYVEDREVGVVTSGVFSPTIQKGIGMGYIASPHAKAGGTVLLSVRNQMLPAKVVAKKSLIGR
jgi:aminomethyltransferase